MFLPRNRINSPDKYLENVCLWNHLIGVIMMIQQTYTAVLFAIICLKVWKSIFPIRHNIFLTMATPDSVWPQDSVHVSLYYTIHIKFLLYDESPAAAELWLQITMFGSRHHSAQWICIQKQETEENVFFKAYRKDCSGLGKTCMQIYHVFNIIRKQEAVILLTSTLCLFCLMW